MTEIVRTIVPTEKEGLQLERLTTGFEAQMIFDIIKECDRVVGGDFWNREAARYRSSGDVLQEFMANESTQNFGIWYGGALVGGVDLVSNFIDTEIPRFWIIPEQRGHQFGIFAVSALARYATSFIGREAVISSVNRSNIYASGVLALSGFHKMATTGGEDIYLFEDEDQFPHQQGVIHGPFLPPPTCNLASFNEIFSDNNAFGAALHQYQRQKEQIILARDDSISPISSRSAKTLLKGLERYYRIVLLPWQRKLLPEEGDI